MASLEREGESERPDQASWSRPGDNKVADDFEGAERVLLVARVFAVCLDDLETRPRGSIHNWLCGRWGTI